MTDPYYKANPGDPITADDWNNMQRKLRESVQTHNHEGGDSGAQLDGDAIAPTARLKVNQVDAAVALTVRNVDVLERLTSLEKQKLPVTGGPITGPLSVSGTAGIGTAEPKARLEVRGTTSDPSASALKVTNAAGANLLEVRNDGATALFDKPLFLRTMGDANHGIAFEGSVDGPRVFGHLGGQLASTQGGTKVALQWSKDNVTVQGDLHAGNSALYFTQPEHVHSGFGNTPGFAAIENAKDYDALMILGRKTAKGLRAVKLWDRLEVFGDQTVTGRAGIGTADPTARLELRGSTSDASASALKVTNAAGVNLLEVRNDGATALFDKPLYLRAMGDAVHGIAFAGNVDGPSVFGNQGGQLASEGGKTVALKWSKSNVTVQGDLFAGNSALYFTQPEHAYSTFGDTPGFAAIHNAKDYDALMILGRMTASKQRVVKLWDRLEVVGNQTVTGTVGIGTAAPPNKRLTIDNPVNNHANLELRQSGGQSWGVGLVINTLGGTDGAAMMLRSRQKNWQLRGENGAAATGLQIAEDGGDAEYGSGHGIPRLHIKAGGDIGIGTTDPQSKLDIQGAPRSGTHPKGRALYVTGEFGEADGVEFRHSNGTQGIGFGHNAIYATGTNEHQDLNLRSRGDGIVRVERKLPKAGKAVFLELLQHNTVNADVYPSLRFHHWGRYWTRIEASNGRFHFKQGDLGSDEYVDVAANRLHIISQDAWAMASPETVRTIRGTVAANNTAVAGAGFSVTWVPGGLCDITFARPFNGPPTVVATQQFTGDGRGGNTLDNAVIVFANARQARIKTGDGSGNPAQREFHFIAIGP